MRAYALLTLSNSAGLPQAAPAIKQMDEFIPRAEREQAQILAQVLSREADAKRSSQLAAADLGADTPSQSYTSRPPVIAAATPSSGPAAGPTRNTRPPEPVRPVAVPPSVAAASAAISEATRVTGTESPANAGAEYASSARQAAATPTPAPKPQVQPKPAPTRTAQTSPATPTATSGPWKVQLGAFSVNGNAEKLWRQLSSRSELAGKTRLIVPAGGLTKLLAGGYPTRAADDQACASLKRSGQGCLVTR